MHGCVSKVHTGVLHFLCENVECLSIIDLSIYTKYSLYLLFIWKFESNYVIIFFVFVLWLFLILMLVYVFFYVQIFVDFFLETFYSIIIIIKYGMRIFGHHNEKSHAK
jgi:hypothetical protein